MTMGQATKSKIMREEIVTSQIRADIIVVVLNRIILISVLCSASTFYRSLYHLSGFLIQFGVVVEHGGL